MEKTPLVITVYGCLSHCSLYRHPLSDGELRLDCPLTRTDEFRISSPVSLQEAMEIRHLEPMPQSDTHTIYSLLERFGHARALCNAPTKQREIWQGQGRKTVSAISRMLDLAVSELWVSRMVHHL